MKNKKIAIGILLVAILGCIFYERYSTIDIYIIRHGQTEWNAHRKVLGHSNLPLNEKGLEQAEQLSQVLSDRKIPIIYSSPLDRAYTTALIIAKRTHSTIIVDDLLKERNFGKAEGTLRKELDSFIQAYPDAGVESHESQSKRIIDFLNAHAKFGIHQLYIVAHGGVIRRMLELTGWGNGKIPSIKNCSIFEFKYNVFTKKYSFVGFKTLDDFK